MKKVYSFERLPPSWKIEELGKVVDFIGGSQPSKEVFQSAPFADSVRLVQIRDFRTDKFPTFIPKQLARRHFDVSDVMIGRYGPPVFQILRGLSGSYNVALIKALPKPSITKDYLFHILQEPQLHHHVVANSERTAGQAGVNLKLLEAIRIPLPPLAEQQRIADILDLAEALRAKRRAALAELDSLTQSIFLDLFGDPAINLKGFPTKPLADLVREDDSINYGVVQPGDDFEGGIPLVRVGDLIDGNIRHSDLKRISPSIESAYKRSRLHGDEILVSCVGSIGVVALVDESVKGFNIARAVARIRLGKETNRCFIAAYLNTNFVQRYFTNELRTVSQPTLNIKQIAETIVVLPPIKLQHEFARRVTAVEKLKTSQRASLAELDALFASLQDRAFKGEL